MTDGVPWVHKRAEWQAVASVDGSRLFQIPLYGRTCGVGAPIHDVRIGVAGDLVLDSRVPDHVDEAVSVKPQFVVEVAGCRMLPEPVSLCPCRDGSGKISVRNSVLPAAVVFEQVSDDSPRGGDSVRLAHGYEIPVDADFFPNALELLGRQIPVGGAPRKLEIDADGEYSLVEIHATSSDDFY